MSDVLAKICIEKRNWITKAKKKFPENGDLYPGEYIIEIAKKAKRKYRAISKSF